MKHTNSTFLLLFHIMTIQYSLYMSRILSLLYHMKL